MEAGGNLTSWAPVMLGDEPKRTDVNSFVACARWDNRLSFRVVYNRRRSDWTLHATVDHWLGQDPRPSLGAKPRSVPIDSGRLDLMFRVADALAAEVRELLMKRDARQLQLALDEGDEQ